MTGAFVPPSSTDKPFVPRWIPPPTTEEKLDWASLHTIDLSLLDSTDEKVIDDLVQLTARAIKEDGFLYLTNYGVSLEQLQRQFALAQYLHANISAVCTPASSVGLAGSARRGSSMALSSSTSIAASSRIQRPRCRNASSHSWVKSRRSAR